MLEGCAKNEVQNAVPNRSIDFSYVKSIVFKGCVRPLFAIFYFFVVVFSLLNRFPIRFSQKMVLTFFEIATEIFDPERQ